MLQEQRKRRFNPPGSVVISVLLGLLLGGTIEYEWQAHKGYEKVFRLSRSVGVDLPMTHDLGSLVGSHWDTRDRVIQFQESQAPQGSLLFLGDSLVEGLRSGDLQVGGRRCSTINAGYAGIGVDELDEHARRILPQLSPRFVVLSVGMNDAWADANLQRWSKAYERLLDDVTKSGATVVVLTINQIEAGHPNVIKSPRTVEKLNAAIRSIAGRHHLIVADVNRDVEAARRRGLLREPLTVDGIHPTGPFFHELEDRWIAPAIGQAESERRQACITTT